MADAKWNTRTLKGGRVRLTGTVRLSCGHDVSDGAQVRDTQRDIEQGKRTVTSLLNSKIREHARECDRT